MFRFRCDIELKLKVLGIDKYVDTVRFFISLDGFSVNKTYKHVFMDEAEAISLTFKDDICRKTISTLYECYHNGNCTLDNCTNSDISAHYSTKPEETWGELWFLVDINQATIFPTRPTPSILKEPTMVLNKVMRSTGSIFNMFKQFYSRPMPTLQVSINADMNTMTISVGHHISGPPTYWLNSDEIICKNGVKDGCLQCAVVQVVIDLCAAKGFKPNELCVIPFLVNEEFALDRVNSNISELFVENGYRPNATGDVEEYLKMRKINDFLISWALRVKGLEFKVVIMVLDEDDFDKKDFEDRRKTYIIASRCTCLLVLVCPNSVRKEIDIDNVTVPYPFSIAF